MLGKDRPYSARKSVTNVSADTDILRGGSVCFALNGTNDGGVVVSGVESASDTSAAVANQLLAGVAVTDIEFGEIGEIITFGYIEELRVVRATRAASTVSYASSPAIAVGDQLGIDTVGNGFQRITAAATGAQFNLIACETAASSASAASTTSDTSTARVDYLKAFIRLM